jgi:hypothetical protein
MLLVCPSVTTPLYGATVSCVLRNALWSGVRMKTRETREEAAGRTRELGRSADV